MLPSPEELKFEAKKYFFDINIDRTSRRSMQAELFIHFPKFQASWHLLFSSPLKELLLHRLNFCVLAAG